MPESRTVDQNDTETDSTIDVLLEQSLTHDFKIDAEREETK